MQFEHLESYTVSNVIWSATIYAVQCINAVSVQYLAGKSSDIQYLRQNKATLYSAHTSVWLQSRQIKLIKKMTWHVTLGESWSNKKHRSWNTLCIIWTQHSQNVYISYKYLQSVVIGLVFFMRLYHFLYNEKKFYWNVKNTYMTQMSTGFTKIWALFFTKVGSHFTK